MFIYMKESDARNNNIEIAHYTIFTPVAYLGF